MHGARPSKYSAEFRSDAIALWLASAGRRTFKDVATDLNVNPETLRTWVRDADGGPVVASASHGTESASLTQGRRAAARRGRRSRRSSPSASRSVRRAVRSTAGPAFTAAGCS
ncbi:transposase [Streptomyces sp. NPDC060031]|uniref:transposase n=1 Tax=Streptomyces sp. NPDC060031 TaxID=3347043 RepID=UPI00367AC81D